MDAAFDPSYEAWDVGHLMLLPPASAAPAAPAAIDSSYLQFNAAAMLAEEDVAADAAIPVSEASSGVGDAPAQDTTGLGAAVRDASPARAALPLPEAEATTEATAVATAATAVAEAATLVELSSYRPSLAPPVSGGAAAGVTAAAVSCANRAVVRSTPPEPPPLRPTPPPSLRGCSSVVGAQRMPGVAENPAATQSRNESGGRVVGEEEGRRGAQQADQQAAATLPL